MSTKHALAVPADPELSPCVPNCAACAEEKEAWQRTARVEAVVEEKFKLDPRGAITREPAPTGEGAIVLETVNALIDELIGVARSPYSEKPPRLSEENLQALKNDLTARSETGAKKYGTPLRAHNGRNAIVDLYQEIQDAIMYAAQASIEGDAEASMFLFPLLNYGTQLAASLNRRAAGIPYRE